MSVTERETTQDQSTLTISYSSETITPLRMIPENEMRNDLLSAEGRIPYIATLVKLDYLCVRLESFEDCFRKNSEGEVVINPNAHIPEPVTRMSKGFQLNWVLASKLLDLPFTVDGYIQQSDFNAAYDKAGKTLALLIHQYPERRNELMQSFSSLEA